MAPDGTTTAFSFTANAGSADTFLVDSVATTDLYDGETMTGSVWLKAHTAADGSLFAIESGNLAGDDRAEILAYVDNIGGGLTVRSFTGSGFAGVPIASGLDASVWHQISFSLTRTGAGSSSVSISVDGSAPTIFSGSLADWRTSLAFSYSESSRLKFRPRHADGDPAFNGFYVDDVSYGVVPAPGACALMGLGGLLAARRRR